ncbi:Uncharacterized protein TCM_036743 [Theobroma cacao]|uniref:Uncharacterized protein n=1 Tax=Theobroma cacao TaxID=3641 RepID=A0A061GIV8_THECC|nr:Uncharacterized protein TCM_036743 [Theobroma cacao]
MWPNLATKELDRCFPKTGSSRGMSNPTVRSSREAPDPVVVAAVASIATVVATVAIAVVGVECQLERE